jgi:PAS domain S-box-containing protein
MPWTSEERSEHERIERALYVAETQLRSLFDQASDGILISDLDARFTDANAAVCRMFGYSRAELLERSIMDVIDPQELPRLERERDHMLDTGSPLVSEWLVRRKDGSRILVEVSAKILPDGRWQAFFRDISERKRIERERELALRQLRAVLDHCPVGIAMISGRPGAWRREFNVRGRALFGEHADTSVEIGSITAVVRAADGSAVAFEDLPSTRALAGERVEPYEMVLDRADGVRIPISVRAAPLVSPEGVVEGAVVAFEDITAEKDLERLRAEWNSVVAHDLRQPLNTIQLYAQLLARLTRGNPDTRDAIDQIVATVGRLNRMIQDLLDLSRLEARQLSLRRREVDLEGLVRTCLDRLSLAAPDRLIDLHVHGEIPMVLVDPDRVQQALDNLLSNALKFGDDGSPIELSLERLDGEVALAVTNRGAGLPDDFLPHLFQRFQRSTDGKLAAVKGIGLGLYITRELVEAHGGRIAATSLPDGSTTFRFTLPIAPP